MKIINIKVTDELQLTSIQEGDTILNSNYPIKLASGNYKSVILNFDFDSTIWDSTIATKYATFSINNHINIQTKIEKIDEYKEACYIPYDVFTEESRVDVGVYGSSIDGDILIKRESTETLKLIVIKGAFNDSLREQSEISPTMGEKLQNEIDEIILNTYTKEESDNRYIQDSSYTHTDNNYTSEEKQKLEDIEANAQKNIIEKIYVNDTEKEILNKSVYLNDTTEEVKNIESILDQYPLVNGKGEQITLNETIQAKFRKFILGANDIKQETTDYPQDIKVITGDNTIKISNKNFIPNNRATTTINGVTFTINKDKSITLNGKATNDIDFYVSSLNSTRNVNLRAGTYTLSGITTGSNSTYGIQVSALVDENIDYTTIYTGPKTITYSSNLTLNCDIFVRNGTKINNVTLYPQLEKGLTKTDYVPHQETTYPINLGDIEYCKIGNSADEFVKNESEEWYLNKTIDKIDLGDLTWRFYQLSGNRNTFISEDLKSIIKKPASNDDFGEIVSTSYKNVSQSDSWKYGDICVQANWGTVGAPGTVVVINNEYSDAEDFKNASKGSLLYFALATSTITKVTDTTLISQLNAVEKAISYKDQTNIAQTNTSLPFIINASALMDISSRLENLTNAIVSLGGEV